jgi:hypothetical protein
MFRQQSSQTQTQLNISTPPPSRLDLAWRAYASATTDADKNDAMNEILAARCAEAGDVYRGWKAV